MDIQECSKLSFFVPINCNRRVKVFYSPESNCWELKDSTAGAISSITLSTRELEQIVEVFQELKKKYPPNDKPMVMKI